MENGAENIILVMMEFNELYSVGSYDDAIAICDDALVHWPDSAELYCSRGCAFFQKKMFVNALSDFNRAIEISSMEESFYYDRALTHNNLGNFDLARLDHISAFERRSVPMRNKISTFCSYFKDGRIHIEEEVYPTSQELIRFDDYMAQGYVFNGTHFRLNNCTECRSCVPFRIDVDRYVPDRSQKRVMARNSDLKIVISSPPVMDENRLELYAQYYESRHLSTPENLKATLFFYTFNLIRSYEIDYFLGEELIAVGIVSEGQNSVYARVFYHNTDYLKRGLGILNIMKTVELAKRMNKEYLYLGEYIEEIQNMRYKRQFKPYQILVDGEWMDGKL